MNADLSIIGLFHGDPSIFDDFHIPDELDVDLLTDNIMMELGEFSCIYSDPEFMKFAIDRWSLKELQTWQDLYNTTVLDYNPIENYNRVESITDLETRDLNGSNNQTRDLSGTNNQVRDLDSTDLETRALANTNDVTVGTVGQDVSSGSDVNLKEVAGYNGTGLTNSEQTTNTLGTQNDSTVTTTTDQEGTDTGTVNHVSTDEGTVNNTMSDTGTVNNLTTDEGTVVNQHDATISGNIGVKTTQEMIQEERKLLEFRIYDYITDAFKSRFCVLVY